jgi:hypothetical protein
MFFKNIFRTIYDKDFYVDAEKHSFIVRYLSLCFVGLIIATVWAFSIWGFYIKNLPEVKRIVNLIDIHAPEFFPKDLEIQIIDGEMSINQEMPYTYGEQLLTPFIDQGEIDKIGKHLVIIDTDAKIEDYEASNSVILFAKRGVMMGQSQNRKVEYYEYANFLSSGKPNSENIFKLNHEIYTTFIYGLRPAIREIPSFFKYLMFGLIALSLVIVPFATASSWLVYLLFLSILGYVVTIFVKNNRGYWYVYRMGIYLGIPLIIFGQLHTVLSKFALVRIPDLSGYTWLVYIFLLVYFLPKPSGTGSMKSGGQMDPPKVV